VRDDDPFAQLGLPARAGLSDDDVRAAWRRIAAATHPDREDGGDPARFGAAAAAYVTLRTPFGRGEVLADLADLGDTAAAVSARRPGRHRGRPRRTRPAARVATAIVAGVAGAIRAGGRGRGLVVRVVAVGAAGAAAFLAAGWSPGTAGVLAGAVTYLTYLLIPRRGT
jgi:curved DNA-binding protein CbpA